MDSNIVEMTFPLMDIILVTYALSRHCSVCFTRLPLSLYGVSRTSVGNPDELLNIRVIPASFPCRKTDPAVILIIFHLFAWPDSHGICSWPNNYLSASAFLVVVDSLKHSPLFAIGILYHLWWLIVGPYFLGCLYVFPDMFVNTARVVSCESRHT